MSLVAEPVGAGIVGSGAGVGLGLGTGAGVGAGSSAGDGVDEVVEGPVVVCADGPVGVLDPHPNDARTTAAAAVFSSRVRNGVPNLLDISSRMSLLRQALRQANQFGDSARSLEAQRCHEVFRFPPAVFRHNEPGRGQVLSHQRRPQPSVTMRHV